MELTAEQVLALAPDASAAKAGKGLAASRHWQGLGCSDAAVWGLCQGSALYQVQVETAALAYKCSCPSRKLPCKHVLGLLLLAAGDAGAVPSGEPPDWVRAWLAGRAAAATKREARASKPAAPADPAEQAKRADRRVAQVAAGVAALDRWLDDLVREGLAGLETRPASFWEAQAARLVDAQAPGLAGRVRRLAEIPGSGPDWPARLLDGLGRLALLTHAFGRLAELDPSLQEDVRQLVGWTVGQDEVAARGETVEDDWLTVGQCVDDDEPRVRTQRTWLLGARSGRQALILQFSPRPALPPFPEAIPPGARIPGTLAFWPSAFPLRARILARRDAPAPLRGPLPGCATLAEALEGVARALARQPWLDRFPLAVRDARLLPVAGGAWRALDGAGMALPLARGDYWPSLALTGGAPCWLAGEWDGAALRPLGIEYGGAYHAV